MSHIPRPIEASIVGTHVKPTPKQRLPAYTLGGMTLLLLSYARFRVTFSLTIDTKTKEK